MSSEKKLDHLTKLLEGLTELMTNQFDDVHKEFDKVHSEFKTVHKELDEITFLVTGQERRISILEDKMRQLAVKVGMEFSR